MKKKILFILLSIVLFNCFQLKAQWFTNGASIVYTGDRVGIGISTPAVKLQVLNGTDASPAGGGYIVAGSTSGANVVIDENEIMARSNGATSALFLNHNGGNLIIDGTNSGSNVGIGTTSPTADLHIVHENGFSSNGLTLTDNFSSGLTWNIYSAVSGGDLWISHNGIVRGTFDGDNGVYTPMSDKKFKKDIVGMDKVLEKVMALKPSLYRFNNQTNANDRKFIGMIAQDVLPLFPEAVYKHNGKNDGIDDFLTLDYSAFGVIAIKAIQEQQQKITSLEDRLAKMEAALAAVIADKSIQNGNGDPAKATTLDAVKAATLEQNRPNPFNQTTTIHYKIPTGANAQLMIYDQSGKLVKTFKATESGSAQINAYELKSGTYTYNLTIDGKLAATKKMVLIK
jgi:hypothetical protein